MNCRELIDFTCNNCPNLEIKIDDYMKVFYKCKLNASVKSDEKCTLKDWNRCPLRNKKDN